MRDKIMGIKLSRKVIKRGASMLIALTMLLSETYIWSILDDQFEKKSLSKSITAHADDEQPVYGIEKYTNFTNKEIDIPINEFVDYSKDCQNFPEDHQADKITITAAGGTKTDYFEPGFAGLGTELYPFEGTLSITAANNIPLNLDAPLFNYVNDNVVLNNDNTLKISREYFSGEGTDETTPILAKNVVNAEGSAVWKIDLISPSDSDTQYLSDFGGFIGTMASDTELTLEVSMNTEGSDTNAINIKGSGDLGFACGHMGSGADLTFKYSGNRDISAITTTGGDVGGLVGEMENGAVFTLKNENTVTSGIDIITSAGGSYAGGIVGKNDRGKVTVKNTSDGSAVYPVSQHITGTSGAGGVYGYYKPGSALTGDNSVDTGKYSIDCQVNGSGYTGGLFGVLDTAFDVTINGGGTITVDHNAEGCTGYGGLIGQYKADSTDRTLSISSVTAVTSKNGAADYYGGGIGVIDSATPAYVEFSSFTAAASNAGSLTFGGLVASADNAFVKTAASTVTASGYMGGGLVGRLENGVLQISGTNTINGTSAAPASGNELKVGKIVGYRDNGLVFMDTGAALAGSFGSAEVDDIGSWGGVIKLDGFENAANVISVSSHGVTIGTSGYSFIPITNKDQFAVTALRFQIDGTELTAGSRNQFVTFANTSKNSSTIANTSITLSGDIPLAGTGIYGLTRDNDIDSSMAKCVYSNTFTGGYKTITFDTGTIYRHKYNGLFAKLSGGTVQNVTFAGKIDVNAKTGMYVGAAAAKATGNFTASYVNVETDIDYVGSETLYIGGILGEADGSIGTINVTDCNVKANIGIKSDDSSCSNSKAVIGGVIGQISHNSDAARAWSFTDVNVSGEIRNGNSGHIGGLAAVINGGYTDNNNHRVLTLNGITVDGLKVSGGSADSMGGLLGYSWLKTDVNVTSVTVQDNSDDQSERPAVSNSGAGGIGGMIYRATGKWTVTSLDIDDIVVSGTGSVGMIVNKGISHDDAKFYTEGSHSAIYLCLPSGYTYNITSSTLPDAPPVFDELCAYTAPDAASVLRNGNGIISINSTFKTDGLAASGSYHARTAKGATANPNSRYYYDLDTVTANSSSDSIFTYNASTNPNAYKNQLMSWGLNQYACTNLKQYFADVFGNTISDHEYDMQDYSWYPVDLDKSITVNGTFKFYSHEFELSEDETLSETNPFDRTNMESPAKTQHYTMHCGLFRNVASGKTLTLGTTTFKGDVGIIDGGSGMLICGTVQGASNTSKAAVVVSDGGSVTLKGAYVYGATAGDSPNYAPLLINKVGSYVNLTIKNVTSKGYQQASYAANSQYMSTDSNSYPKAASSLIGNVGLSDAPVGITVNFSSIKLDGRTDDIAASYNGQLNTVYGSDRTVFTRSTLLNQFRYASGSTGAYNYTYDEDWDNGAHTGKGVTYGKEVGYTSSDTYTEYPGKEQKYSGSTGYYTSPDTPAASSAYSRFITGFIPYVYEPYNSADKKHQLRVNHGASTATGCGTYNDPYILSDGSKLEVFCDWINNGAFADPQDILIPTAGLVYNSTDNTKIEKIGGTLCGGDSPHTTFTYNGKVFNGTVGGTARTITPRVMRTYLAGAYYQIPDEVSSITIPSSATSDQFIGLGNTVDDFAVFRGVIDGNGKTLINNTAYPLIESSNGSVVKDLTIEVDPPISGISLSGTQKAFNAQHGDGENNNAAYGAVIAKIFGGDNIIDNVSLALGTSSAKANISLGGTYAQLVPVGGYVGVIVNGGLYFRNMKRIDENNDEILYDESLFDNVTFSASANGTADTAPMSDSNKEWLYVNPIVGRVINGFAVTESYEIKKNINGAETIVQRKAYRPYEDGTRTYKGGTEDKTVYWNEEGQTEENTAPTSLSHVTMQNGNKHYSIADISSDLGKLSTAATPVGVPNGQALFIMSAIVNSGMSDQSLGYSSKAVGTDNNYFTSRGNATYKYVGKIPTDDPENAEAHAAYLAATADYAKAANDGTDIRGYLMTEYTTGATDIAGSDITVKLTTENGKYYLPDGFKGIGNMYAHDDNATTNVDENDSYRMKITNFDGSGATVSMNSSWYFYMDDISETLTGNNVNNKYLKLFDTEYHHHTHVGFGLFNYQNGATTSASDRYYNFILKGNVVADCIDSSSYSGANIKYKSNNTSTGDKAYVQSHYNNSGTVVAVSVDGDYMVSAGGLIGVTDNTQYLDRVALQNMYVHGLRYSGGLIGLNMGEASTTFTYRNTKHDGGETLGSSEIKVIGASTCGGMIGKNQNANISIDNGNASYSITKVESECTYTPSNGDFNYGVGGFIGACRTNDANTITISNIAVGDYNVKPTFIIADSADIFTGGMIGILNKGELAIRDCTIYNQSVSAQYVAGGLCGYYASAADEANISNVKVLAKDFHTENEAIENAKLTTSNKAVGGFFGAIKQEFKTNDYKVDVGRINIFNSEINGYDISAKSSADDCYAGGAIGLYGHASGTNCDITWNLYNVTIENCNIDSDSTKDAKNGYAGGIVGGIAESRGKKKHLYGYNILTKDLEITGDKPGSIYGKLYNAADCCIKLAGFSRQGTMIAELAGETSDPLYGEGGYVIFADYDDTASTEQNALFANVDTGVDNVVDKIGLGTKITTIEKRYVAKRNSESNDGSIGSGDITLLGENPVYDHEDISNIAYDSSLEEGNTTSYIRVRCDVNKGYKLYYTDKNNKNQYFTNQLNNKSCLIESTKEADAAVWYFEEVGTDKFKIYTYINEVKKYISSTADNVNTIMLSETKADIIYLYPTSEGATTLYFKKDTENRWLQHSGGGGGIRYYTTYMDSNDPTNNVNSMIKRVEAGTDEVYKAWKYNNFSVSETEITSASAPTSKSTANETQTSNYSTHCGSYNDDSYELFYVIKTVIKHDIIYEDNLPPYVTTNPKLNITDSQFLTGDGVSNPTYLLSALRHIIDDQKSVSPKAYTTVSPQLGLNENAADFKKLRAEISTSNAEFRSYLSAHTSEHIKNFPLLVAEDTNRSNLTDLINNYLRTLTNTNINFADTSNSNVFTVGLYKYRYNESTDTFENIPSNGSTERVCLKNEKQGDNYYFSMDASNVDTRDIPQFTLMDVQFYDPSNPPVYVNGTLKAGTGTIAYHLYVPVYVKKVLRYNFNAHIKSGTDYYWSAYDQVSRLRNQALFENLGNPVTIALEWEYTRTGDDWKDAINGGDNLLINYYKSLMLKSHIGSEWPADTTIVLVDANNNDKMYYLNTLPTVTGTAAPFSLYDFTDSGGNHFKPVDLNELMTVTVEKSDSGTLTPTDDVSKATLKIGSTYYRPISSEELENTESPFDANNRYTVASVTEINPERYYLSIFTKANNENNVYHYEMYSVESFDESHMTDTTQWRANKINDNYNTILHLYTGKLYENDLDLRVAPVKTGDQKMSKDNNYLKILMTTNVRLTETAKTSRINENMRQFTQFSSIYQTFLMMYDKKETADGSSKLGIDREAGNPLGYRWDYYKGGALTIEQLGNVDLSNDNGATAITGTEKKITDQYVELRNNQNLIELLADDSNDNAVTIQTYFEMAYSDSELVYQFPKKGETETGIGSSVIGYSKIASTKESAAYSATSEKKEDGTRYYTADDSTAKLTYNVVEAPEFDPVGPFSSLGINAAEIDSDDAVSTIDTVAVYDVSKLKTVGDYITLTFSLSKRSNYNSRLPIASYLTGVTIYGKDGADEGTDDDVIFPRPDTSAISADDLSTSEESDIYSVTVNKDLLKTNSDGRYVIPIKFSVKTGNSLFKNTEDNGLEYSNYKVTVSAVMCSAVDGTGSLNVSYDDDHIIYTNARILTSVVE